MDTVECPLRQLASGCLDEQIRRLQGQRARLAEHGWRQYDLAVILYFSDKTNVPLRFTRLDHFSQLPTPGRIWISGMARGHPGGIKRDFSDVVSISSEIVSRQVYDN